MADEEPGGIEGDVSLDDQANEPDALTTGDDSIPSESEPEGEATDAPPSDDREHLLKKLGQQGNELGELRKMVRDLTDRLQQPAPAPEQEKPKSPEDERYARLMPDAEQYYAELLEDRRDVLSAQGFSADEIEDSLKRESQKLQQRAWRKALADDDRINRRVEERTKPLQEKLYRTVGQTVYQQDVTDVAAAVGADAAEVVQSLSESIPLEQWEAMPPEVRKQAAEMTAVYTAYKKGTLGKSATIPPPQAKAPNVNTPTPRSTKAVVLTADEQASFAKMKSLVGNAVTDEQLTKQILAARGGN